MQGLQNMLFGPLNKDACVYFYFFTVFFYFLFIVMLILGVVFMVRYPSKIDYKMSMHAFVLLCNAFLGYFVNRLLYTMCNKSLA